MNDEGNFRKYLIRITGLKIIENVQLSIPGKRNILHIKYILFINFSLSSVSITDLIIGSLNNEY